MSYMTISSQENHHFSLCSYFHAHPTTLLLKILGGTNAWAVPPPQILGGTVPPVPPRSPPLRTRYYYSMSPPVLPVHFTGEKLRNDCQHLCYLRLRTS